MVDVYEMAEEVDASGCGYDVLLLWGLVIYFCNVSHQIYFWIDFCSLIWHELGSELASDVQGVDLGSCWLSAVLKA